MRSRRQHCLQSSLDLFLEACRLWGKAFENDYLLMQIEEMEDSLQYIDMDECSEEMVNKVELASVQLVNSMDNLLKAMGDVGFCDNKLKH